MFTAGIVVCSNADRSIHLASVVDKEISACKALFHRIGTPVYDTTKPCLERVVSMPLPPNVGSQFHAKSASTKISTPFVTSGLI
jgi:hypothetical protein